MNRTDQKKLTMWQDRLEQAKADYQDQLARMTRREELVSGSHDIYGKDGKKLNEQATHVRNVAFEIVETQVDSNIPKPKVTAMRKEDEGLAEIIENMLRNELDRLPIERINDEGERIGPTQGGYILLVEWLSRICGRGWVGDLQISLQHPRKVIPQPGIYQVADMDYIFILDAISKKKVKQRYGVDVSDESEEHPDIRGEGASKTQTDELVTMVTAFYRNEKGGVGRIRWTADTILEDLEDYQIRRVQTCTVCGAVGDGNVCRYCGSKKFQEELQQYETLTEDIQTERGTVIPAVSQARDENGQPVYEAVPVQPLIWNAAEGEILTPFRMEEEWRTRMEPRMESTRIPYYKPDVFPVVLRKNVSKTGQMLGGSDVDAIADQQNALNKLCTKINRKVLGGGSFTTKPKGLGNFISDGDNKVLEIENPAELAMIQTFNTQVDISPDLTLRNEIYEEARQTIGITDSMQGRKDPTATSAIAKQFAAQQAAGRMESKRIMKHALFQDLFEIMFKFMLAYADEPRNIVTYNEQGQKNYMVFDRHDFLYQDEAGNWKYNTDFLFSCDSSEPLAANREAMWQETRMNFQQGAFGSPQELTSVIRFWGVMEQLHYPMAKMVREDLQKELEKKQAMPPPAPGAGPTAPIMM